jgi:hypothetical protein
MSEAQKEEYRGLDDLVQNIRPFTTVDGAEKAELLQFTILMAMFGDKDTEHPVKVLYFPNDNDRQDRDMYEFPKQLNRMFAELGKKTTALRLYGYEHPVDVSEDSPEHEDAEMHLNNLDERFLLQHSFAWFGAFANSTQELLEKSKDGSLELHAAVYQYCLDHREEHLNLWKAV